MGQYHLVINLDKKQYLHPCRLGDGQKLLEFADGGATVIALALLLAQDNGRGIGDLHVAPPDAPLERWERNGFERVRTPHAHLVGSWARDRIVIAGDYGDKLPESEETLHTLALRTFEDVSAPLRELIACDPWLKRRLSPHLKSLRPDLIIRQQRK
jgi:hypothetical protein